MAEGFRWDIFGPKIKFLTARDGEISAPNQVPVCGVLAKGPCARAKTVRLPTAAAASGVRCPPAGLLCGPAVPLTRRPVNKELPTAVLRPRPLSCRGLGTPGGAQVDGSALESART